MRDKWDKRILSELIASYLFDLAENFHKVAAQWVLESTNLPMIATSHWNDCLVRYGHYPTYVIHDLFNWLARLLQV